MNVSRVVRNGRFREGLTMPASISAASTADRPTRLISMSVAASFPTYRAEPAGSKVTRHRDDGNAAGVWTASCRLIEPGSRPAPTFGGKRGKAGGHASSMIMSGAIYRTASSGIASGAADPTLLQLIMSS